MLRVLRRKERWPCFEASPTRFGLMGFRAKGFHEKSSETTGGTDQSRKRFKNEDDSDHDSEDESPKPAVRPLILLETAKRLNRVPDFNNAAGPFLPAMTAAMPTIPTMSSTMAMNMGTPLVNLYLREYAPPAYSPQQEFNLIHFDGSFSFLETAAALLNRFYVAGMDAWGTILSIGRMLLVSKGWAKPPTMEDATRILTQMSERYPGSQIVVIDPTCRQQKDRIITMSASAQACLGNISRTQGGLDYRIIADNDAWSALTATFAAYNNPGAEFPASVNILCKDSTIRPTVCSFSMFPKERVLVVRAVSHS